ncbi:MAG TPA: helix-turn-helix transcriptional regulator [Solirubrobacteraceae bacterium]|jgi:transcriptional regulator with XRE-family HTH domain|nr:helix-turn-helix transcriptional regulator [Solirubrobacteraceae bacterium]
MERPAAVIEQLRATRGLTQAEACQRGGLPPATWSMVESGFTENPHPATKLRIARALGVTPSSIWQIRPLPLHLEDVEDPRWKPAVRAMARRLDREGTLQERQRFASRLAAVLDFADPGRGDWDSDGDDEWDEFWQLAKSLLFDAEKTPIAIIDGKLVERDLQSFTPATPVRMISARRRTGDGVA